MASGIETKSFVFRFADVTVREREFAIAKADKTQQVEPKAFRVLLMLIRNPNQLIAKDELLSSVWGETAVTENSLARNIAHLRRLLGDDPRSPRFIETVSSIGYRFICPVEVTEDTPALPAPIHLTSRVNGYVHETQPSITTWERKKPARRPWLALVAVSVLGIIAIGWYLHRPLPPPRITSFTKITHDGQGKTLIGTDGNRLYLFWGAPLWNTPTVIGQVAISGGEIATIPVLMPAPQMVGVSQDGSSILVASNTNHHSEAGTPLWSIRLLGGTNRRLPDSWDSAFSPDGHTVAYSTLQGDIWFVGSDGTGAHKLASVGGVADHFAWSPDGKNLRFTMNDRLWEITLSGSNLHQLLPGWRDSSGQCCGRWTPDGKFFVFRTQPHAFLAQESEIWALDERRGLFRQPPAKPVQLTTGPIRWDGPVPGNDGRKIFAVGTISRGELSRFDGQAKRIDSFLGGISAEGTSFSNDGRSVAYVLYPEGTLWKANRDGSSKMQLTDPPLEALLPRWSPDGTEIVFTDAARNPSVIDIVSVDGGVPRRLLPEDSGADGDPTWSPDGRRIVFSSWGGNNSEFVLRILDIASHQVQTVPGSNGTGSPRWSPDGRFILAMPANVPTTLRVFDIEAQRWSELPLKGVVGFPEWSRDSQFIYFVLSPDHGVRGIYRTRVKGGEVELVVDLKDWKWAGWWDSWMGLDPTDAPLLLRNIGSSDIYALSLNEK